MARAFRVEHIATKPAGWKVRTVVPGRGRSDHRVRVAFPPGRRHKGSGRLLEILHPRGERNPQCEVSRMNPSELLIFGNPDKGHSGHKPGCPCFACEHARKIAAQDKRMPKPIRDVLSRNRNSRLERQRAARDRAARIRRARLNPDSGGGWKHFTKTEKNFLIRLGFGAPKDASEVQAMKQMIAKIDVINKKYQNPKTFHAAPGQRLFMIGKLGPLYFSSLAEARKAAKPEFRHQVREVPESRIRRNPEEIDKAVQLFQSFHGRDPEEIVREHVKATVRLDYTALGDLEYLIVKTPLGQDAKFNFDGDGVVLASAPDGRTLYCVGGDQNILPCLDRESQEKDFIDVGEAIEVQYLARKIHGEFRPVSYYHEFGEINGTRPRIMFDKLKKQIFFVGGDYWIDTSMPAPGTPLGKISPGIEN